ncbi:homeodomain-like superfamily protein [Striga asiatica]|uniref:Homeodomain-like superfamily protein n=1 Tax=Striga asiatica TaxID=4170 RepID=A0A5A7QND4_STRAF|nr:homeodomain-like superfamily protein [Striga asiatica]
MGIKKIKNMIKKRLRLYSVGHLYRNHTQRQRMVSKTTNPPEGFYLDPTGMALPNLGSFSSPAAGNTASQMEDPSKKVRKPYTITKSRESWTEPEHDKFLEALQLFDRDWKKIEAFVGSKTVIQIRSHAQKYFLKAQKSGTNEHLPPPRPKRKAAHPYPQKASKSVPVVTQDLSQFQASTAVPGAELLTIPDHSAQLKNPDAASIDSVPAWIDKPVYSTFSHVAGGDARCAAQSLPNIYPSSGNESMTRSRPTVLPDFAQVYSFIGSVFDPNETSHLQKLKLMDPIDIETVLLLMRNLSINLASPDFEVHRRLLSSYEIEPEKDNAIDVTDPILLSPSGEAT